MDLGFFVVMGVIGGLLGATFNCLNKRLAKYRMRNVHPKPKLVRYLCSRLPQPAVAACALCGPSPPREATTGTDPACHTGFDFLSKTENVAGLINLLYFSARPRG